MQGVGVLWWMLALRDAYVSMGVVLEHVVWVPRCPWIISRCVVADASTFGCPYPCTREFGAACELCGSMGSGCCVGCSGVAMDSCGVRRSTSA